MSVRTAVESEIHLLAEIWTQGWQDAHARIMPAALARLRTRESFRERLAAALPDVRVAGPEGAPVGFCMVKDDELYQLYVAPQARGTGIAAVLVADAETLLAKRGVEVAWLACAVGNDRAARFYEKYAWRRVGTMSYQPDAAADVPPLQVWRYEKRLAPPVPQSDGAERRQPVRVG
jgi:ribosomal protein S18 acetylase RimI-like enzyme